MLCLALTEKPSISSSAHLFSLNVSKSCFLISHTFCEHSRNSFPFLHRQLPALNFHTIADRLHVLTQQPILAYFSHSLQLAQSLDCRRRYIERLRILL